MSSSRERQPGELAPEDGPYRALNVFGSPSGPVVHLSKGEVLPLLPLGHSWLSLDESDEAPN